ncbi:hypothetical protein ATY38_11910 [Nitrosomonas ureae]|nr:hypothetical protein ATY38_11910 [Nitrosomonas ureae]
MRTFEQPIKDKSFYRAGTLKRIRRTNHQLDQLDNHIVTVLIDDHPQSVRHIFYRMTDPRLPESVEKSDAGYRHVQDRCVKLRRSGRIPYAWIADMSRRGYYVHTYSDASEFISKMAGLYRADLWAGSDHRCEVWCESRSIASVIQRVCTEMAVDLYPCGGFASLSFAHYAAEQHNRMKDYRPLTIFYIGDYDPAGVMIDRSLERELRLHLDSRIDMSFDRIGINEYQIAEFDLPTKPRKKSDTRSQQVISTVEAEAMPAHILRDLLRYSIESLLPEGALHAAKIAEQSEREGLKILAKHLRGAQ